MTLDWQKFVTEPEPGIIEFTLKPEHVKLLRNAKIYWDERGHGAPACNPDRPYGGIHIWNEMIKVLELDTPRMSAHSEITEFYTNLMQLHQETALALQVILKTGKFKATTYRADKFTQDWKEYNPNGRKPKTKQLEMDV